MKALKKKLTVPIYEADLWIILSKDIAKERASMVDLFGEIPHKPYEALCSYSNGNTFGLFFDSRFVCLNTVAHEVFHLTHRILEWSNANFDSSHHEQGALLNGYLMESVCREIGLKL